MSLPTPSTAVITPVGSLERLPWLLELHRQVVAEGAVHVLSLDGFTSERLPQELLKTARIVESPRKNGAAAARNLALAQVEEEWVTTAEDDDLLPPYSLSLRLTAARGSGVSWVAGLIEDVDSSGKPLGIWDCPARRGINGPGDVYRKWPDPSSAFPLGPTTLLAKSDLVKAVGGWGGLPQGEDLMVVVGVTGAAPGLMLNRVVYRYRKHPGQSMEAKDFHLLEAAVREAAWQRGLALLEASWTKTEASFPHIP